MAWPLPSTSPPCSWPSTKVRSESHEQAHVPHVFTKEHVDVTNPTRGAKPSLPPLTTPQPTAVPLGHFIARTADGLSHLCAQRTGGCGSRDVGRPLAELVPPLELPPIESAMLPPLSQVSASQGETPSDTASNHEASAGSRAGVPAMTLQHPNDSQ